MSVRSGVSDPLDVKMPLGIPSVAEGSELKGGGRASSRSVGSSSSEDGSSRRFLATAASYPLNPAESPADDTRPDASRHFKMSRSSSLTASKECLKSFAP